MLTPAVYLVVRAAEANWTTIETLLLRERTYRLLINTIQLSLAVTVLSIVIGVALAWCATRGFRRGRPLMIALLSAPLAIPSYVSGFVWTRLFPGFEGFPAAVLVLTMACYPLVMLPAIAALSGLGRAQEDAARTLGCSPLTAFLRVTAPRMRTAVLGGGLLVALYAISDFGGPAIVRYEPFTVGIYNAYNGSFDRTAAAVYGCVLAVMALGLAITERLIRRDTDTVASVERAATVRNSPSAWAFSGVVIAVGVVVPIIGLLREIGRSQRVSLGSAAEWADLAEWVWPKASATLTLSLQAALVIAVLALPLAFFVSRPRTRTGAFVESATYIGYALPGVTVALSMVFIGVRLLPDYYLTTAMLIAAYVVLFIPVCLGPLRSTVDDIPNGLDEVSRTLKAGAVATAMRVILPIAAPGLLAGTALACLSVAKELPATLMLAPVGTRTLATDMWSLNADLSYGLAAVLGLVLIVVTSIPTVILSSMFSRGGESK